MGSSPILGENIFAHLRSKFKLNYTFFDNQSTIKLHKAAVDLHLSTNHLIFTACKRILFTGGCIPASNNGQGGVWPPGRHTPWADTPQGRPPPRDGN